MVISMFFNTFQTWLYRLSVWVLLCQTIIFKKLKQQRIYKYKMNACQRLFSLLMVKTPGC